MKHQLVVCEPGGAPRGGRAPRGLRLNKHMVLDFLLALADAVRRAGLASDAHPDPVTAQPTQKPLRKAVSSACRRKRPVAR